MLLDDMEFSRKAVEDLCGTALASLPEDHGGDPQTDVISSAHYLNDWMQEKIFESTSYLTYTKKWTF